MSAHRMPDRNRAIYVISIAAELAGVHPQTLRIYERKGLVSPQRTSGNSRRYSDRDIETLRRIQELTNEGVNLAGVLKVMELEDRLAAKIAETQGLEASLDEARGQVRAAMESRDSFSILRLRDIKRVRRAMKVDEPNKRSARAPLIAPPVSDE